MGWDDHDDYISNWDEYEYVNKLGIYAEDVEEPDPDDDLFLAGLDPDELSDMSEDSRRKAIEDEGLDPDDYDYLEYRGCSGRTKAVGNCGKSTLAGGSTAKSANTLQARQTSNRTDGKWGVLKFTGVISLVAIAGYGVAAFGGQLLGAVVVIIIGIAILCN